MHTPATTELNREPNVVPMIDILLVLLIVFILANVYERMALDLQLPQEPAGTASGPQIVLEVLPGPRYAINGTPVAPGALAAEIAAIYRGRPEKVMFVKGDPAVRYQDVIHAVDVARGAGVRATGVMLTTG